MSALDHKPTECGCCQTHCIWCHDSWPCEVAKLRLELAKEIVKAAETHQPERARGMADAAQLLLKGLTVCCGDDPEAQA